MAAEYPTQLQMYYAAERKIAAGNQLFMELINHPTNPLTNTDLAKLVARWPQRWGRFAGFLGKLKD